MAACRAALWLGCVVLLAFSVRGGMAEASPPSDSAATVDDEPRRYDGRTVDEWRTAMKSLELTSPAAAAAVPGLIALVCDPAVPQQTRAQAAYTLGRIGTEARSAVPVLTELLEGSDDVESPAARWAAKALALYGPVAAEATPRLAKLAANVQRPLLERLAAAEALGRIGGAHPNAVPTLLRLAAANGPPAESVFESQQIQGAALDSLALAGPAAAVAVPTLIQVTRADAADLRKRAAAALGAIGTTAGIASGALVDLVLFDEVPEVRDAAAAALATIGESGDAALQQLLTDEDVAVRRRAATAFARIKRPSDASRRLLVVALDDADVDVRLSAVESLLGADHDPERLNPVLLEALTADERLPRIRAYRILISIPPSASLLSRLRTLTDDERSYVRQVARKALEQLAQPQSVN